MSTKFPYDLHLHSVYSGDAELSPEDVFKKAKNRGLKGIVITDHNAVRSIDLVFDIAKKLDLFTCQGIEISTKHQKIDIHILGYSLNFNKDILLSGLKQTLTGYNERTKAVAEKINELGIAEVDFSKLEKQFPDFYVPKPKLAEEVALQTGKPFKEVLVLMERGGPAYVPYGDWAMSPKEAVNLIKKANGISVLAHPGDFLRRSSHSEEESEKILIELLDSLKKERLSGIEAVYSMHTSSQNEKFKKIAKEYDLIATGGSDWHGGKLTPDLEIGDFGVTEKEFSFFRKTIDTTR